MKTKRSSDSDWSRFPFVLKLNHLFNILNTKDLRGDWKVRNLWIGFLGLPLAVSAKQACAYERIFVPFFKKRKKIGKIILEAALHTPFMQHLAL